MYKKERYLPKSSEICVKGEKIYKKFGVYIKREAYRKTIECI